MNAEMKRLQENIDRLEKDHADLSAKRMSLKLSLSLHRKELRRLEWAEQSAENQKQRNK